MLLTLTSFIPTLRGRGRGQGRDKYKDDQYQREQGVERKETNTKVVQKRMRQKGNRLQCCVYQLAELCEVVSV